MGDLKLHLVFFFPIDQLLEINSDIYLPTVYFSLDGLEHKKLKLMRKLSDCLSCSMSVMCKFVPVISKKTLI